MKGEVMIIRYMEDLLVLDKWVRKLIRLHFSRCNSWADVRKPVEIRSHLRTLDGKEVDLMITDGETTIIVELKSYDIEGVIRQALERRRHADYIYVCLNLPAHVIVRELKKYEEAVRSGIGFISADDECIVLRAYPQRRHRRKCRKEAEPAGDVQILDLLKGGE